MNDEKIAYICLILLILTGVFCFGVLLMQQPKIESLKQQCKDHGGLYLPDYRECVTKVENWR